MADGSDHTNPGVSRRAFNPKLAESQTLGGVIQGISYALDEERHLDPASGHQLNANIDQYKIVGSRETPEIEVLLLEQLGAQSSTPAAWPSRPTSLPLPRSPMPSTRPPASASAPCR